MSKQNCAQSRHRIYSDEDGTKILQEEVTYPSRRNLLLLFSLFVIASLTIVWPLALNEYYKFFLDSSCCFINLFFCHVIWAISAILGLFVCRRIIRFSEPTNVIMVSLMLLTFFTCTIILCQPNDFLLMLLLSILRALSLGVATFSIVSKVYSSQNWGNLIMLMIYYSMGIVVGVGLFFALKCLHLSIQTMISVVPTLLSLIVWAFLLVNGIVHKDNEADPYDTAKLRGRDLFFLLVVSLLLSCHYPESQIKETYRNPIIYADVPDMSVTWAQGYYYMVSTTMHLMPGAPIMRSKDLRHWETISYAFERIEDAPRYDLLDSTVYGQGQWASSLRYHDGQFYLWFGANGTPYKGFLYTATKAEGPWKLLCRPPHFHDGSLFFDDDGRIYMFFGSGMMAELESDFSGIKAGTEPKQLFFRDEDEQGLLEGSAVTKHNGRYYLLMISMDYSIPGRLRREVCYRADSLNGEWTKKVILETAFEDFGGVGQGCIIEGPDGEWNAMIFQDRGGVGRVPCLMPCTWKEGWPILGDLEGKIPNDTTKSYASLEGICGSDDFESQELSLYWQWNHNPVDSAWSLTECPGGLRLHTSRIVKNLFLAPNTISQRMAGPASTATVIICTNAMRQGDCAGIAAFNSDSGVLSIEMSQNKRRLVMSEQRSVFKEPEHAIADVITNEFESIDILNDTIYLRIHADFQNGVDSATFFYSLDGETFKQIGKPVHMTFDHTRMFMGSRFALFNFATKEIGGYVDFLDFDYLQEL